MTPREALMARAHEDFDPASLAVLADYLEEHGEGDLAYAYRWAAGRNHYPRVTPKTRRAVWERGWVAEEELPREPWRLPWRLMDSARLHGSGLIWTQKRANLGFRNAEDAFRALALILKDLRELVKVLPLRGEEGKKQ